MAIINVTQDNSTVVVSNGDTVYLNIAGGGTATIVAAPGANIKNLKIFFVGDNQSDTLIIDLSTFSSYDLHIDINDYDSTDTVILQNAFNRYVMPGNEDEYNFSYYGVGGAIFNGFIRAKDKGEKNFNSNPAPVVICFAKGTAIDTDLGPTLVEALRIGDKVRTRDRGLQPIRWIGRRDFDSLELTRYPNLRPVRFAAGSLGRGLPFADLVVSPQHRMLAEGWQAELHFGQPEMLVPAIGMVNDRDIAVDHRAPAVSYFHVLFDRHEIITANGVACESLHTGDMAMAAGMQDAMQELHLIFPDAPALSCRETARPVLKVTEANVVARVA